jgi:hypothetical protein
MIGPVWLAKNRSSETRKFTMKGFIKEYRLEILAVFIALVGILLLINPFGIRVDIFKAFDGLKASLSTLKANITSHYSKFSTMDVLGWLIVIGGIAFGLWRVRYRFLESELYNSRSCPKCGADIKRTRRKRFDRIISKIIFVPFHRYFCSDYECGWSGLRKPGRHHHQKKSDDD